jgi:hypothetical protein
MGELKDKVFTGAEMPIGTMREVAIDISEKRENAFKASGLITTEFAAQHVKKQAISASNDVNIETFDIIQKVKELIDYLFPAQFVEATIATEDRQTLQFVAEANNKTQVTKVMNAYKNGKTLGLSSVLTTIYGNKRTLKETNIPSLSKVIGSTLTDKVLETIVGKLGLTDEQMVTRFYKHIFPDISKIGKIGGKVLGKIFFIYGLYSKIKEVDNLMDKYRTQNDQKV